MADFDLIQTDAQVQSILNDGQNMQGAGAQTTLTTESVLLKDENGNYHKILKSSFTEAIRDTLAGLLINNDKGTTINQIAAIASGDFGSITPANLASVLGVDTNPFIVKNYPSTITSMDDATTPGYYFTDISWTNLPFNDYGSMLIFTRGGILYQYALPSNSDAIYFRRKGSSGWGTWQRIDNYGTSSLSELASVLGGYKLYTFEDEADFISKSASEKVIGGYANNLGYFVSFKVADNRMLQFKHVGNSLSFRLQIGSTTPATWITIV